MAKSQALVSDAEVYSKFEDMSLSGIPDMQPNVSCAGDALGKLLFDDSLLSKQICSQLPDGYVMRPLSSNDYSKGFMECLAQLTNVGDVSESVFQGKVS